MHKYIKEPFSALSHTAGAALSVVGLFILLQSCSNNIQTVLACAIYGVSMILLYTASSLTHGIHCSEKLSVRFEKCDRAAIFLLIAGTYTPVSLLVIKGTLGWAMLSVEWIAAFVGILSVFFGRSKSNYQQVCIYLFMGWLFIFAIDPITKNLSAPLLASLIGGGLFYSVGAIFFLTNRPAVFARYLTAHDLWHLFVLSGSLCHFYLISYLVVGT